MKEKKRVEYHLLKSCRICGSKFFSDSKIERFCSDSCREIYERRRDQKTEEQRRKRNQKKWDMILKYMKEHDCQYCEAAKAVDDIQKIKKGGAKM